MQVFRNPFVTPSAAKNKKNSLLFPREVKKNSTKIHSSMLTTFAKQCSGRELFYFVLLNIEYIWVGGGGVGSRKLKIIAFLINGSISLKQTSAWK